METPFIVLAAGSATVVGFWTWVWGWGTRRKVIGDAWHIRKQAYTGKPTSAPYCWRPLTPFLGRWLGFRFVSGLACWATPLVLYVYLGGGWAAVFVGLAFLGNRHIGIWALRNAENAEALGHLLLASTLLAISTSHWAAYPLAFLAVMCRETLGAALGVIALVVNPFLLLPLAGGGALAWLTRREDKEHRHPLVKETPQATLKYWLEVKRADALGWPNVVAPVRGAIFAVPAMWGAVPDFARYALIAVPVVWAFSLPASGAQRLNAYTFALFAPFVYALGVEWAAIYALASWFWPYDFSRYDESGNTHGPRFRTVR